MDTRNQDLAIIDSCSVLGTDVFTCTPPLGPVQNVQLVVLLHGYGGNAEGFLRDFLEFCKPRDYGSPLIIAPSGGQPCNLSRTGRRWFPLSGDFVSRNPDIERASATLRDFLIYFMQSILRVPFEPTRITLVGFSQGATIAFDLGIRILQSTRLIVGIAGHIHSDTIKHANVSTARCVWLYGDRDQFFNFDDAQKCSELLKARGINIVMQMISDLAHEFSEPAMRRVNDIMASCYEHYVGA